MEFLVGTGWPFARSRAPRSVFRTRSGSQLPENRHQRNLERVRSRGEFRQWQRRTAHVQLADGLVAHGRRGAGRSAREPSIRIQKLGRAGKGSGSIDKSNLGIDQGLQV